MFFDAANSQLQGRQMQAGMELNCRPRLRMTGAEMDNARKKFEQYPRPWIFICPRSNSFAARTVPDGVWKEAAQQMPGTKFWIGLHPGPDGIVDLAIRHFDLVILYLAVADLLVTVDTGPIHVGAALNIPIVGIGQSSAPDWHLNDQNDYVTVWPDGLDCLDCQQNLCPKSQYTPPCQSIDPAKIVAAAKAKLHGGISACISCYKPEIETLNRCLGCVLPQVKEVIICYDQAGQLPGGIRQDPKIKIVKKAAHDIGYGRKQNYAVRHSTGEFVLLLNDDVFLDPGAVEKMMMVMAPGVGMVSNHLRYPDGTIYHAGKVRSPGQMGWSHADYKKYIPRFQEPTELENCCGACVLVRRKAFYEIDGFDEEFYIFAEDDAMCLALRRAGWKIIFTPHSTGIHMEHQSVKKTGDISGLLARANATFSRKWGKYLDWNRNRVPGDFNYTTS
jgi:GT2 family glycosyltransferase